MVGLMWTVYMMHGLSWKANEGRNLITNIFLQRYPEWEEFQTKRKEKSKEKKNQTRNTREQTVSENYSKENDGDETIPKEQSKPETHSIREIVAREEVNDGSNVNQEEQCEPSIQEIVPLGEIHDDSKEHLKEQCHPETQNSQERSQLEQCQPDTQNCQERPQLEQCLPETQNSHERSQLGSPQEIT